MSSLHQLQRGPFLDPVISFFLEELQQPLVGEEFVFRRKHPMEAAQGAAGFRVQGSGFRVQGSGFRVWVQGAGFFVQGSGFRVPGSGFSVERRMLIEPHRGRLCVQESPGQTASAGRLAKSQPAPKVNTRAPLPLISTPPCLPPGRKSRTCHILRRHPANLFLGVSRPRPWGHYPVLGPVCPFVGGKSVGA